MSRLSAISSHSLSLTCALYNASTLSNSPFSFNTSTRLSRIFLKNNLSPLKISVFLARFPISSNSRFFSLSEFSDARILSQKNSSAFIASLLCNRHIPISYKLSAIVGNTFSSSTFSNHPILSSMNPIARVKSPLALASFPSKRLRIPINLSGMPSTLSLNSRAYFPASEVFLSPKYANPSIEIRLNSTSKAASSPAPSKNISFSFCLSILKRCFKAFSACPSCNKSNPKLLLQITAISSNLFRSAILSAC